MKKFMLLLFAFITLFLCSCENINEIEKNTVVTACIVKTENNMPVYMFYVSVPKGAENKEGSGLQSSKVYEFRAKNFSRATELFNDAGTHKLDISHLTLFAADKSYFENTFANDEQYLRKSIPSTPLIYTFMYDGNIKNFVKCINSQYSSKADNFAKSLFESKTSPYTCTLSELSLAEHNKYYTAILPVVNISDYGDNILPNISGTAVYSSHGGLNILTDDEHLVYSEWRKKHKRESEAYNLSVNKNILKVKLKNSLILDVARKYSMMNVDILNLKYYARRCFWTYNSYNSFMNNFSLWNIMLVGDSI